MVKMSKAQAKKRLIEAQNKLKAVYMATLPGRDSMRIAAISTQDMAAMEKIIAKCVKRTQDGRY
tara:strand:- start:169 stop:360 length:192 start_codon:yes stop_codon:yes gene_type:complete